MKFTHLLLLFTCISLASKAQSYYQPNPETGIAMGLSGGYSSKQSMLGTLSIGVMVPTKNHISMNMVILSDIRNSDIPSIFEARYGHVFNSLEIYGGAGYHIAGGDSKISLNPATGFRPAYGVIKHFSNSPWILSAGMSGNIFALQVGLFGVR